MFSGVYLYSITFKAISFGYYNGQNSNNLYGRTGLPTTKWKCVDLEFSAKIFSAFFICKSSFGMYPVNGESDFLTG